MGIDKVLGPASKSMITPGWRRHGSRPRGTPRDRSDGTCGVVNRIITDLAVIDDTADGLVLIELAPEVTLDEVRAATAASLILDPALELT